MSTAKFDLLTVVRFGVSTLRSLGRYENPAWRFTDNQSRKTLFVNPLGAANKKALRCWLLQSTSWFLLLSLWGPLIPALQLFQSYPIFQRIADHQCRDQHHWRSEVLTTWGTKRNALLRSSLYSHGTVWASQAVAGPSAISAQSDGCDSNYNLSWQHAKLVLYIFLYMHWK